MDFYERENNMKQKNVMKMCKMSARAEHSRASLEDALTIIVRHRRKCISTFSEKKKKINK